MISGRKDCRSGEQKCTPWNEAEAFYCQGNHAEATRNQLAETMEVNPSTLGNWLDPHHASRMPEDRREELFRLTDDHSAYVRFLAARQGLSVYDPRTARGRGVTRMVSEFSELLKSIDDALDDGKVTVPEAERITEEARDLHGAVDSKVAELRIMAGLAEQS